VCSQGGCRCRCRCRRRRGCETRSPRRESSAITPKLPSPHGCMHARSQPGPTTSRQRPARAIDTWAQHVRAPSRCWRRCIPHPGDGSCGSRPRSPTRSYRGPGGGHGTCRGGGPQVSAHCKAPIDAPGHRAPARPTHHRGPLPPSGMPASRGARPSPSRSPVAPRGTARGGMGSHLVLPPRTRTLVTFT